MTETTEITPLEWFEKMFTAKKVVIHVMGKTFEFENIAAFTDEHSVYLWNGEEMFIYRRETLVVMTPNKEFVETTALFIMKQHMSNFPENYKTIEPDRREVL